MLPSSYVRPDPSVLGVRSSHIKVPDWRLLVVTVLPQQELRNTTWADIDIDRGVRTLLERAEIENGEFSTTRRFCLAVRIDLIDRPRIVTRAARVGSFGARLARTSVSA